MKSGSEINNNKVVFLNNNLNWRTDELEQESPLAYLTTMIEDVQQV